MQHGYQCGLLWGSALAAGAQSYQVFGAGTKAEAVAVIASQKLVESFRTRYKYIDCLEITKMESKKTAQVVKFFLKGGAIRCFSMAAKYASIALREIDMVLSEKHIAPSSPPVSCASMLAQKMGLSDKHTVMVAGLAGGIGLSGGGCGALGAAIWMLGIGSDEGEKVKVDVSSTKAEDIIIKFLAASDYEFECSKIVGRKFESVEDHSCYMRDGGCSEIVEALANDA